MFRRVAARLVGMSLIRLNDVTVRFEKHPGAARGVLPARGRATGSASSGGTARASRRCSSWCSSRCSPTRAPSRVEHGRAGSATSRSSPSSTARRRITEVLDGPLRRRPRDRGRARRDRRRHRGRGDRPRRRRRARRADRAPGRAVRRDGPPRRLGVPAPHRHGAHHARASTRRTARARSTSCRGGWRNRAALAKIVLEEPDVLLLDEPTNFLDVAGVEWLEALVPRLPGRRHHRVARPAASSTRSSRASSRSRTSTCTSTPATSPSTSCRSSSG